MQRTLRALILSMLIATPTWAAGGLSDRFWYGGGVGAWFGGNVDSVSVHPLVGVDVTDELSLGVGLSYRYRRDSRFSPTLSTKDYGGNVFARYRLSRGFFLHGEYERLSYEFRRLDGSRGRDDFDGLLAGPGFQRPTGRRGSLYAVALYNFNYDDSTSPYDDPWVVRVGVTFGF